MPEERPTLVSIAFGAVTGTLLAMLIRPIIDLVPGTLFEEFFTRIAEAIITVAFAVIGGYAAHRTGRLDHLLAKYLLRAATIVSIAFSVSLWLRAARPMTLGVAGALVATTVECWLLLFYCGAIVRTGLFGIAPSQEKEYLEKREADAQEIAMAAIAEGDPGIAAGLFGLNAAGAVGAAWVAGCLFAIVTTFHIAAVFTVAAVDAHVLFRLSAIWSVLAGAIIALASTSLGTWSMKLGERFADSVPIGEKYKGILPVRDTTD